MITDFLRRHRGKMNWGLREKSYCLQAKAKSWESLKKTLCENCSLQNYEKIIFLQKLFHHMLGISCHLTEKFREIFTKEKMKRNVHLMGAQNFDKIEFRPSHVYLQRHDSLIWTNSLQWKPYWIFWDSGIIAYGLFNYNSGIL